MRHASLKICAHSAFGSIGTSSDAIDASRPGARVDLVLQLDDRPRCRAGGTSASCDPPRWCSPSRPAAASPPCASSNRNAAAPTSRRPCAGRRSARRCQAAGWSTRRPESADRECDTAARRNQSARPRASSPPPPLHSSHRRPACRRPKRPPRACRPKRAARPSSYQARAADSSSLPPSSLRRLTRPSPRRSPWRSATADRCGAPRRRSPASRANRRSTARTSP